MNFWYSPSFCSNSPIQWCEISRKTAKYHPFVAVRQHPIAPFSNGPNALHQITKRIIKGIKRTVSDDTIGTSNGLFQYEKTEQRWDAQMVMWMRGWTRATTYSIEIAQHPNKRERPLFQWQQLMMCQNDLKADINDCQNGWCTKPIITENDPSDTVDETCNHVYLPACHNAICWTQSLHGCVFKSITAATEMNIFTKFFDTSVTIHMPEMTHKEFFLHTQQCRSQDSNWIPDSNRF